MLFFQPDIDLGVHHLPEDESNHVVRVLRSTIGNELEVTNGKGGYFKVRVTNPDARKCAFDILERRDIPKRNCSIHIAIAPTKNADRIEWFVEKSVELGIDQVTFVLCKTSERKTINLDRIEKISVSAMKQSGQCWLPKINPITPFREILKTEVSQKFIAYVDQTNPHHLQALASRNGNYLVLIGPEGDFSSDELQWAKAAGFLKTSLGANRLRTETAGVAACHILNLINS